MNKVLFVGIIVVILATTVTILAIIPQDEFTTNDIMHPCQMAALDYVKSYDKSTKGSISVEIDGLTLMNNDLDCYDMVTMEPKGDWYTEEFEIQLKKELIKSFTK